MEILHTEPIDIERIADLCAVGIVRPAPSPRDHTKYHVTQLLDSAHLITKGDVRYSTFVGHPKGIMSLGRIWETSVDCYLADTAHYQGGTYIPDVEQEQDDIIASLDGILHLPDYGLMVAETKLRFTQNKDIPLKHIQQMRAYCYLLRTDTACYTSGHVSSNPPEMTGVLRIIRFTQESIAETWKLLTNTKSYLESKNCLPQAV
jgi:hypothetical protein